MRVPFSQKGRPRFTPTLGQPTKCNPVCQRLPATKADLKSVQLPPHDSVAHGPYCKDQLPGSSPVATNDPTRRKGETLLVGAESNREQEKSVSILGEEKNNVCIGYPRAKNRDGQIGPLLLSLPFTYPQEKCAIYFHPGVNNWVA